MISRGRPWVALGLGVAVLGCAASRPVVITPEPVFSVACVPTPGGGHHVGLLKDGVEVAGIGDCASLAGHLSSVKDGWFASAKAARLECIGTVSGDCASRLAPTADKSAVEACYQAGVGACESSYENARSLIAGR
jgi:hypothetical protein